MGIQTPVLDRFMAGLSDAANYSRLWLLTAAAVAAGEAIGAGTGLAGLDAHQVRHWTCGRRWTVLAMLAHAFRHRRIHQPP